MASFLSVSLSRCLFRDVSTVEATHAPAIVRSQDLYPAGSFISGVKAVWTL